MAAAAAASAPGREVGGGGSGGRREAGGSEKPRGPRRRRLGRGGRGGGGGNRREVAGAEQSGADPAPSLRLGARARPWPRLPALGERGKAWGRSLQMPPVKSSYRETPVRKDVPGERHARG